MEISGAIKLCTWLSLLLCPYGSAALGKKEGKEKGRRRSCKTRPHIIMIVADDLGWDDVGFHGSPQIPTPNIDHLANNGVILNQYYVSPICTPTRASLMTGKHPIHLGVQHETIFGTQPYGLPLGETTTPQYLKALGYTTRGVGKWHLGFFEKEYTPPHRGFDSYYGFWNGKEDYWDHSSEEDVWGIDLRDNMKPVRNETGHYGTELFTEVAQKIIYSHNKSTPLYLYLAQQAVHSANGHDPLQAPQRLIKKFKHMSSRPRKIYSAMVAALDESVGNITRALNETGMLDNSVIVFTTDNGGAPNGFNWNMGCNFPFRGGKDTFWEGGVRGVGFVYSKLIKKKPRVSYDLIDVTDWMPTFYHLAGGDVANIKRNIDGLNVWDTIAEGKPSPRTEVLHNIDPLRKFAAIRNDRYKLVVNQDAVYETTWHPRYEVKGELDDLPKPKTLRGAIIDCGKWNKDEMVECNTNEFPCLFDMKKDPCEYNNIAQKKMHVVRNLLLRLINHQKKAKLVWFPDRDPKAAPSEHNGFWGPWRKLKNKNVLQKAKDGIPKLSKAYTRCYGNQTTVSQASSNHVGFKRVFKKWNNIERLSKSINKKLKNLRHFAKSIKKVENSIKEEPEKHIAQEHYNTQQGIFLPVNLRITKHTGTKKFEIPSMEGKTGEFEGNRGGFHVKVHLDATSNVNHVQELEKDFSGNDEDANSGDDYFDADDNINLEGINQSDDEYRRFNNHIEQKETILSALNTNTFVITIYYQRSSYQIRQSQSITHEKYY